MEHNPRVLIIENSKAYTGAFKSIFAFSEYLNDRFEFFYCLPSDSKIRTQISKNLITIPFLELRRSFWVTILYLPYLFLNSIRIHRFCKRQRISIIHVNDLYNLCGVVIKFLWPSYKVVYHVRLMRGSYVRFFYDVWLRLTLNYADQVICVSNAVKKNIADSYVKAKVTIIYDAIPEHENYPDQIQPPHHEIKLLYLSNYISGKGQKYALRSFKIAQDKLHNCLLVFAGGDMGLEKNKKYKMELLDLSTELGIRDSVQFTDFVSDSELLIKTSDILLNFSESESFSMTCLEAMFYGTPVIASDSGGPAELIENEISGLLVPNRNVNSMAEAIVRLSSDAQLRSRLANSAKLRAKAKFSLKKSAESLAVVYNDLIQ
ncbi:MAG: glycosyltransferase family 4 protein [Cyclobacteriaceae bacterium]